MNQDIPGLLQNLTPTWNSRDVSYWRELFHSIHRSYRSNPKFAKELITAIRFRRYHHRRPLGGWETRYAFDDRRAVEKALADLLREVNDHCIDNIRVADWSKRQERNRYNKQKASGCCGSVDRVVHIGIFFPREFHIGLNYGH